MGEPSARTPRLMRTSRPGFSLSGAGGRLRPSLKWQPEHDRALNNGPSPSRVATDPGAAIQF
jgi:hypothetical protein